VPVVELVVVPQDAELAADALWQGSPSAVAEELLADGRVRLVADVADLAAVPDRWSVRLVDVDPGLEDTWRSFAAPWRAGRRLVIAPAWNPPAPGGEADDLVVSLDPGRVFGSGSHVSTRQVLAVLEDLELTDRTVLDVGSGSGVLAIVALRLGASTALAVDVDPTAVAVALDNAARNGVADRLEATDEPIERVAGRYDVVLANIGVAVLERLAPILLARTTAGGRLVLAGLLDAQADRVVAAYAPAAVAARVSEDGWTALVLRA
jgi:ribosomal protein L11 methyltransferase